MSLGLATRSTNFCPNLANNTSQHIHIARSNISLTPVVMLLALKVTYSLQGLCNRCTMYCFGTIKIVLW